MALSSNHSIYFPHDPLIVPLVRKKSCSTSNNHKSSMATEHNIVNENTTTKLRDVRQKSSEDSNFGGSSSSVPDDTPWPTDPAAYELMDVIGEGATATVNAAICTTRNRERCAIKRINLEKVSVSLDELIKEIQAMSLCNHENVVNYFTSFVTKEELWLVMRLLGGGSLLDIIKYRLQHEDCSRGVFDEATISTVLRETLKGLEYFHNNGQIHRDIKAGNILLGTDGGIQIADFGVAAFLQNGVADRSNCRYTFVGTPCFMAPEVMEQVHGYNFKADIWSFGITAIELATGKAPYHKFPPMKVLMLTLQNEPPTLETNADHKDQYKHFSKTFRRMLAECLQKDPNKRPTAAELIKHPFFRKARDKNFLKITLIDTGPGMTVKPGDASAEGGHTNTSRKSHGSGRFYRTESGEWQFSSDEEDNYREYNAARAASQMSDGGEEDDTLQANKSSYAAASAGGVTSTPSAPTKTAAAAVSSNTMPAESTIRGPPATPNTPNVPTSSAVTMPNNTANATGGVPMSVLGSNAANNIPSGNGLGQAAGGAGTNDAAVAAAPGETLSYVLRVRNAARELNDIRFEFVFNQDTPDGIASELVSAGLIDGQDRVVMAANLAKIIESYGRDDSLKSIIFSLPSGVLPGEVPDEGSLIGYAQLTLI